ncbi:MAG TPA: low affinity iron permease family protein [Pseudolabrys sp.]|nr:low affinity iron permease family protein [Pseudolabrys sp.]
MARGKKKRADGVNGVLSSWFSHAAQVAATASGHAYTFMFAVLVILAWVATGPLFGFSDTWQLIINTGTTIVTFLMVFLIQNTQNRDMMAMQVKLSELVFAIKGAENRFASIEDLSDAELQDLHDECRARAEMLSSHLQQRGTQADKQSEDKTPRAAAQRAKTHQRKS